MATTLMSPRRASADMGIPPASQIPMRPLHRGYRVL
jgi:hypothetical protein